MAKQRPHEVASINDTLFAVANYVVHPYEGLLQSTRGIIKTRALQVAAACYVTDLSESPE